MKKQLQSGFAIVELVVAIVVVAAIVVAGYLVWHNHNQKTPTTAAANTSKSSSNYQSPTTTTPTAPQVKNASDLNSAMQALNQTGVTASNADSSQLSTQASGF